MAPRTRPDPRLRRAWLIAISVGLVIALGGGPAQADVLAGARGDGDRDQKAPLCRGKTKREARQAIRETYNTVFNATSDTLIEDRIALIEDAEDDPELGALVDAALARAGGQVSQLSATIRRVRCRAKRRATVRYDVVDTFPVRGTAVLADGTWRVSKRELCDLLSLFDPTLASTAPCLPERTAATSTT